MKSKSFIQLILFLIVILSSFIVYKYFFSENKSVKIIDSQPNEIQPQNFQSIQSKVIDTDNIIEKL